MVGRAFQFTGSSYSYVAVPDDPAWTFGSNAFTFELWQRVDADQDYSAPIGQSDGPGDTNKWLLWTNRHDGNFQFLFDDPGPGYTSIASSFLPSTGQWYHVAVTRDTGGHYVLYRDGNVVGIGDNTSSIPDPTAELTIGGAEMIRFIGLVDEVSIYTRALAQSEVAAIAAAGAAGKCTGDSDEDGVPDTADNCPAAVNPEQADRDGDGIGDVCDGDLDGDGSSNEYDNCPAAVNPEQADRDGDRIGDVCDGDLDGDGFSNEYDNCPALPNPDQRDSDGDRTGDLCDPTPFPDNDSDGVPDDMDNCVGVPNPDQANYDGDREGDVCDHDVDGDGVMNEEDAGLGRPWDQLFQGFFAPVDNSPTYNKVKAGAGIPIRFSIGGGKGLNIFASFYPKAVPIPCPSGASTDQIEETASTTGAPLVYSAATGQYTYVWATPKSWAGACGRFDIRLRDGTYRTALFQFTK